MAKKRFKKKHSVRNKHFKALALPPKQEEKAPVLYMEMPNGDEQATIVKKLHELLSKFGDLDELISIYDCDSCDLLLEAQEDIMQVLERFEEQEPIPIVGNTDTDL